MTDMSTLWVGDAKIKGQITNIGRFLKKWTPSATGTPNLVPCRSTKVGKVVSPNPEMPSSRSGWGVLTLVSASREEWLPIWPIGNRLSLTLLISLFRYDVTEEDIESVCST